MSSNKLIAVLIAAIALVLGASAWQFFRLLNPGGGKQSGRVFLEDFRRTWDVHDGKSFGEEGFLTFELFRDGTFEVVPDEGYARQVSGSYRDSAIIRSTGPLPETYKVSAVIGGIDYDLDHLNGLSDDPDYGEGPKNENGCYLLAITDEPPTEHYTNDWWHKHRKVVIDVDNNVWGHGMPNPVFMVYFDRSNDLRSYNGKFDEWQKAWDRAVEYEQDKRYRVEVEKTAREYILRIFDEKDMLLEEGTVDARDVWHADDFPDYFVIGEPHENYYQGSMKIYSISLTY